MEIEIDFTKSAQKNAEEYFAKAKKDRLKAEGAEKAIKDLEAMLKEAESAGRAKKALRKLRKKEWYERFDWFFTSHGLLAIGGRSADQNEELNSRYFSDADLFFHADIFGASVVILKGGADAGEEDREEAAQFSASFSKAWESSLSSADVYSLKRIQVTKSSGRGSLGKGSFLLTGERQWYKSVPLSLAAFLPEGKGGGEGISITPLYTCERLAVRHYVQLSVGSAKKSDAAKFIAKRLGYDDMDYIMQHIPPGPFSLKEIGTT